ncbi:MAG: MFS transporter [Desulfobacterales bacterium]|nr:MFS transporter [Desulfobacterales bacterium]
MFDRIVSFFRQFPASFWVLSLGWFVSALGFGISIPFVSIYFHGALGLSLAQIGLFFGFLAVVRSFFQLLGGEISDRFDRRKAMIHYQWVRAAAFLVTAVAIYRDWGFWPVAASILVNSVFGALYQPAANAAISDILPEKKRLDGFAVVRSSVNLGWAAGPALGGFLAVVSYGLLFVMSAVITAASAVVVLLFLRLPETGKSPEQFRLSDLVAVREDPLLAVHAILIFVLYLVHSQLIAPFSVYAVDMVHITERQLGMLYTLNGLMVVALQIPITRGMSRVSLTSQMALGALIYAAGYTSIGFCDRFGLFVPAVAVITFGEIIMSPAALALTSRLAPEHRTGRYMGIFGFAVAAGWSFGPLIGGTILDVFGHIHPLAWSLIASMAMVPAVGYWVFARRLPKRYDLPEV